MRSLCRYVGSKGGSLKLNVIRIFHVYIFQSRDTITVRYIFDKEQRSLDVYDVIKR